eukprot:SM000030S11465  [mRNA]  locus=s30:825005:831618:+ [translate_table: standard]
MKRQHSPWRGLLLLLCAMLPLLGHALFEDEVGMSDWHQSYIGKVKLAKLQTYGQRKRVFVATEQNVLAALNLRSGELIWRHAFAPGDHIDGLHISGKYVITLIGGIALRAWTVVEGTLIWETILPSSASEGLKKSPSPILLPLQTSTDQVSGSKDVLILAGGVLSMISVLDGIVAWQVETQADSIFLATKSNLVYTSHSSGAQITFSEVDMATGTAREEKKFQATSSVQEKLALTEDTLFAVSRTGESIFSASMSVASTSGTNRFHETLIVSLFSEVTSLSKASLCSSHTEGAVCLTMNSSVFIVEVGSTAETLRVTGEYKLPVILTDSLELDDGRRVFAVVQPVGLETDHKIMIKTVATDSELLGQEVVSLGPERGTVLKVFLNAYLKKGGDAYGFRALVVCQDHSLALLQQGEVVWLREEALAGVVDACMTDLPLEKEGVLSEVEHDLAQWFRGHFLGAKATLMLATPEEKLLVQELRQNSGERSKMTRDRNGFRKLVVAVTSAGKAYALHTGDGHVIWSRLLTPFRDTESGQEPAPKLQKVLLWKEPHKNLETSSQVVVLGTTSSGSGLLLWLDANTGKEMQYVLLPYTVQQVIKLALHDALDQRLFLLIDENANAHLLPESREAQQIFEAHLRKTFFYIVDKERGVISGYRVKKPLNTDSKTAFIYPSEELWTVVFPVEVERIALVATKAANEGVYTQAKVLGDRNVLLKYLNPNTAFIATTAAFADRQKPATNVLTAYLIDTVTGDILYRVTHAEMSGPVHAVFSENWVVYHYFNVRSNRFEVSVLELFDESPQEDMGEIVKQALRLKSSNYTSQSSYRRPSLKVAGQSYFFPHSIKSMAVTATSSGITTKNILVGTIRDQVLALDKRLVDPRRSLNPMPQEREEGLLPYTDTLPINPQSYITHRRQVEGLRGILAAPSRLESTTLVFAYGLDLFFTRSAPSRTYDTLSEEFNYFLLLFTIFALVLAILVIWVLSARKDLQYRWK